MKLRLAFGFLVLAEFGKQREAALGSVAGLALRWVHLFREWLACGPLLAQPAVRGRIG